ncbi:hypothetical protein BIW11_04626 [Tropilaelaps mercedesae]|uniref:Uncharacterized protein n=1 Tax=Tropilaelaps mercedesae TaxID=418985 RepID=A0A1V9X3Z2_9ACAR|nr:hypothetical protein BIW11_04626 [Tropilaelaps mercedesae]
MFAKDRSSCPPTGETEETSLELQLQYQASGRQAAGSNWLRSSGYTCSSFTRGVTTCMSNVATVKVALESMRHRTRGPMVYSMYYLSTAQMVARISFSR